MPMSKEEREYADRIEADENYGLAQPVDSEEIDPDIKYERVTVRLSRDDTRRIDEICRQKSIGRSTVLRMALREWLAEEAQKQEPSKSPLIATSRSNSELTLSLKLGTKSVRETIERLAEAGMVDIEEAVLSAPRESLRPEDSSR